MAIPNSYSIINGNPDTNYFLLSGYLEVASNGEYLKVFLTLQTNINGCLSATIGTTGNIDATPPPIPIQNQQVTFSFNPGTVESYTGYSVPISINGSCYNCYEGCDQYVSNGQQLSYGYIVSPWPLNLSSAAALYNYNAIPNGSYCGLHYESGFPGTAYINAGENIFINFNPPAGPDTSGITWTAGPVLTYPALTPASSTITAYPPNGSYGAIGTTTASPAGTYRIEYTGTCKVSSPLNPYIQSYAYFIILGPISHSSN